ncbi:MAG: hypothetical protein KIT09_28870 [Bryobacteraceae bacterium]|nr:hypothetical protein [Bryobacteraceae bacterium]
MNPSSKPAAAAPPVEADAFAVAINQSIDQVVEAYRADFHPSGVHEEMLVRELALADWRLRQLTRVETGMLWLKMSEICEAAPEGQNLANLDQQTLTLLMGASWYHNAALFSLLVRYQGQTRRAYYTALKHLERVRSGKAGYLPSQPDSARDQTNPTSHPKAAAAAAAAAQTNPNPPANTAPNRAKQNGAAAPAPAATATGPAAANQTNPNSPSEPLPNFKFDLPNALDDFCFGDSSEFFGIRGNDPVNFPKK